MLLVPSLFALLFWAQQRYEGFFATEQGQNVEYAGILLGNLIVYWIIAHLMSGTARDPGGRTPGWYYSSISSARALAGISVSALIAAALPYLSLVVYFIFSVNLYISRNPEGGSFYEMFYPNLLLSSLRLLHYALAAGCLALVLRRSLLAGFGPPLLALSAMAMQFWDISYFPYAATPEAMLDGWYWPILLSTLGFLLLLALHIALRRACAGRSAGGWHLTALCLLLGLPLAVGLISGLPRFIPQFTELRELGLTLEGYQFVPLHMMAAQIFPDVYQVNYDISNQYAPLSSFRYIFYGAALPRTAAMLLLVGLHFISLSLWWETARACLEAQRRPPREKLSYPRDFLREGD